MTDAKELVAEINKHVAQLGRCVETWEKVEADPLLLRARDWIERWAPVEAAAREAAKAVELKAVLLKRSLEYEIAHDGEISKALAIDCRSADRLAMEADMALEKAIAAALGEDKP